MFDNYLLGLTLGQIPVRHQSSNTDEAGLDLQTLWA